MPLRKGGHARVIDALLLAGSNVDNRIEKGGKTALHQAAEKGQSIACAALLEGGAKIDAVCTSGCSALFYAVRRSFMPPSTSRKSASPTRGTAWATGGILREGGNLFLVG